MPEVRLTDKTAIMEQLRAIEQNSKLTDAQKFRQAKFVIENAPTIEAEPVRHGRWKTIVIHDTFCFQCSACNAIYNGDTHYCPNCGARMDGGADNG